MRADETLSPTLLQSPERAQRHRLALEHERHLLSAILGTGARTAIDEALEADLQAAHFGVPRHGSIWWAITTIHERGEPVSTISVLEELTRMGADNGMGALLSELQGLLELDGLVTHHARCIRQNAMRRGIAETCSQILGQVWDHADPAEVLDGAQAMLQVLGQDGATGPVCVDKRTVLSRIATRLSEGEKPGMATGYADLDKLFRFKPGELILIAARPSMGKTALAFSLALQLVRPPRKIPVAFFSLEMDAESVLERGVAALSGQDLGALDGSDRTWSRITDALAKLDTAPLHLDETTSLELSALKARSRALARKEGIGAIFVDYIQLMRDGSAKGSEKRDEVDSIAKGLKALARELKVPVIALSQINREAAKVGARPQLHHLAESGTLEQHADVVLFVHRPEYYLKEQTPEDKRGVAEVIIAKQRNGAVGVVELAFHPALSRFSNLARGYQ